MRRLRRTVAACGALLVVAGAPACGGDDEAPKPAEPRPTPAQTGTIAAPDDARGGAEDEPGPTTAEPEPPAAAPSPEDEPGGAGDEEAIRTEAVITGRGGRLSPGRIAVPPFIAVNVLLRSADGARYEVSVNGRQLAAPPGEDASLLLDGLPPGRRYVLRPSSGAANSVTIVPDAEPGP